MMVRNSEHSIATAEARCADCGGFSSQGQTFFDSQTHSEVHLCPNCLPAFLQRQQFPPGCCGE